MNTRCPACGSQNSLDALIGHTDAGALLVTTLKSTGALEKPLTKYLGLFRPVKRSLTFERANKLINELLPDIQRQAISRNQADFPAPAAAWVYAIDEALKARDNGKLITPLDSHGWLYTVISRYKPELHQPAIESPEKPKKRRVLLAIEGMSDDEANNFLAKHLQLNESMQQCFSRLIKEQENQDRQLAMESEHGA